MESVVTAATGPKEVIDQYGRRLKYLRISVTDVCNLSCHYCNPVKGCAEKHPHKLSWDDLEFLIKVAAEHLGVEAIRITGGEPTVRPGLTDWLSRLRKYPEIIDISMTTNGILLAPMSGALKAAGLTRVTVSLDSFQPEKYASITRGGSLERCLEGIHAARRTFGRVKINAVLLKDFNIAELPDFVEFSHENNVEVRFIELMPIYGEKDYFHRMFVSVADAMESLSRQGINLVPEGDGPAKGNRTGYGPATTYRVEGSRARIGFISQMSNTKCLNCNKLRLTSDGALKACLLSPKEQDLAPLIHNRQAEELAAAMRHQFMVRAERYDAIEALESPFHRGMQSIGG